MAAKYGTHHLLIPPVRASASSLTTHRSLIDNRQLFELEERQMHRAVPAVFLGFFIGGGLILQGADPDKSLYERLGGQPAVEAVASGLVDRILADKRVNSWFRHAAASTENANAYKAKLALFICAGVGGPCKYTGLDMVAAHKGRGVTSEAFNAVAQDLSAQLDQLRVPEKEKNEVMAIIGSLKPSIVQGGSSSEKN
jgi:hemoglobin